MALPLIPALAAGASALFLVHSARRRKSRFRRVDPRTAVTARYRRVVVDPRTAVTARMARVNPRRKRNPEPAIIQQFRARIGAYGPVHWHDAKGKKRQTTVDSFTASAVVQIYDKLNEANKAKFAAIGDPRKMATIAWKLSGKANPPRRRRTDGDLKSAYAFFKSHAGGIVGEAAKGALQLAKAERIAANRGWRVHWRGDDEMTQEDGAPRYIAVLVDSKGEVLGSLGGIDTDSGPYARVIEAELALEALNGRTNPARHAKLRRLCRNPRGRRLPPSVGAAAARVAQWRWHHNPSLRRLLLGRR